MRAVHRFTVRAHLPDQLAALSTLATNLRWSWHPPTQDLFAEVDPEVWAEVGGDPLRLLSEVPAGRLSQLAHDDDFVARTRAVDDDLRRYLTVPRWYQQRRDEGTVLPSAVAYFSMEFGLSEALPNYSGGLGVLAGDHLKSASDLGLPLIGVGLLYGSGYFRQTLSPEGWQHEHYPVLDPRGLALETLTGASGEPIVVRVAMPEGRTLRARIWRAQVGRVPLLLLDTDLPDNDEDLRGVTDRLFGGDPDHRLRQEILVGIGGVRAVRAYCEQTGHPQPEVFHTNESHAGFLGLERVRELQDDGLHFDEAVVAVRAGTVFTTHTPVPAGIDRFPVSLMRHYFGEGSARCLLPGVSTERVLALGAEDNPGRFNMAHMGLRLAQRVNGVSELHGGTSREMFRGLWPGFGAEEVPIGSVTNGVHGPTWSARELGKLLGESEMDSGAGLRGMEPVSDSLLWELRSSLRQRLVDEVRRRLRQAWLQRGASELELNWCDSVFDPDVLTIGFARRVPTYKRLTLMLRDTERLRQLLLDPEQPVQVVVAGKSHPDDEGGKAMIQKIVEFADDPEVRHRIAFLPDHDMSLARYLVSGCDVWLNTPVRPLEACGTSGMKAALNGALNLSIRDGWWDEMFDGSNGWAIPNADGVTDPSRRDDLEAETLYELISEHVAPMFYERNPDGVPRKWMSMVRHTLATLGTRVQSSRMVREYVDQHYGPAARSARSVVAENYRGAKEVAEYRARLHASWSRVRITGTEMVTEDGDPPLRGAKVTVRAWVELAGLDETDVNVEVVVGRVDDDDELHDYVTVSMTTAAVGRFEAEVTLPHAGPAGYTARVLPQHSLLSGPAELGRVVLADS